MDLTKNQVLQMNELIISIMKINNLRIAVLERKDHPKERGYYVEKH